MVAFYKHDIHAWRGGTGKLSDRAYRVYHIIVEEIMAQEGPIALHEKSLAGLSNRSVRDFRAAIEELIKAGKIVFDDAGRIGNGRTEKELRSIKINRENAAKGGRILRERSASGPRVVGERSMNSPRVVDENATTERRVGDEADETPCENNASDQAPLPNALHRPLERPSKPKREEKRREEIDSLATRLGVLDPRAQEVFEKLLEAAENHVARDSLQIEIIRPITDLMAMGCDLDRHILPTVRRKVPSLPTPLRTWGAGWLRAEILAAREADRAKPSRSAEPSRKEGRFYFGPDHPNVPERNLRGMVNMLFENGYWPRESPKPGEPGCQMPDKYLPEHLWSTACSGVSVEQKKTASVPKVIVGGLPEDEEQEHLGGPP